MTTYEPATTFVCPTCSADEMAKITSLFWGCLLCGTLCLESLSPNRHHFQTLLVPRYYKYFQELQQLVKDDNTKTITKSAIKALQGLHQQ